MTQRQILERAERVKNPIQLSKQDFWDAMNHFSWCCAYCGVRLHIKKIDVYIMIMQDRVARRIKGEQH